MSLSKALEIIGDDNIVFQYLDNSTVNVKDKSQTKDTDVTFATRETTCNDHYTQSGKMGVVVWVDRDDWDKAVKELVSNRDKNTCKG